MKICCISDMHGHFVDIPECDLLCIAGDICPAYNHDVSYQALWLKTNFTEWRRQQPAKYCVFVAGNHDFVFERAPELVTGFNYHPILAEPNWLRYLQDSYTEVDGVKIYGSPWQKPYHDWAFNLEEERIAEKWEVLASDTDIVISHGPPYGIMDLTPNYFDNPSEHAGSQSFMEAIAWVEPKLVVYGHIHDNYGQRKFGDSLLVNAAIVSNKYEVAYPPMLVEINDWEKK